jgi:hypothetical protein
LIVGHASLLLLSALYTPFKILLQSIFSPKYR